MTVAPFEFGLWFSALPLLLAAATITWLLSLPLRNAGLVDPLWSLMLFAAGVVYALGSDPRGPRLSPVLWLCALWAARLAWRNLSRPPGEPRRYAVRRAELRNFPLHSLYRVFWSRALCAWLVSLPLLGAFASLKPWSALDAVGVVSWMAGFGWQAIADWQLRRFRARAGGAAGAGDDAPLRSGLWRFSRHPHLFGELFVWLGFLCFALAAGAWWALPGALLMAVSLGNAAGALPFGSCGSDALSRGGNGRPHYADYVLKTNAFFPGRPRD